MTETETRAAATPGARLVGCRCNACGAAFTTRAESFEEMTALLAGEPATACPSCGLHDAAPDDPEALEAERGRQPAGGIDAALAEMAVGIESTLRALPADDLDRLACDLESLSGRLRAELSRRRA